MELFGGLGFLRISPSPPAPALVTPSGKAPAHPGLDLLEAMQKKAPRLSSMSLYRVERWHLRAGLPGDEQTLDFWAGCQGW
jgi:hypothetical protein